MTFAIINEGCRVKNAKLILDRDTKTYHLIHYDTEILTVKYHNADIRSVEIIKALKCSNSSTRAIMQVADFLNIDKQYIKNQMVPYYNFVKYNMSTEIYKKKGEFMETIEN